MAKEAKLAPVLPSADTLLRRMSIMKEWGPDFSPPLSSISSHVRSYQDTVDAGRFLLPDDQCIFAFLSKMAGIVSPDGMGHADADAVNSLPSTEYSDQDLLQYLMRLDEQDAAGKTSLLGQAWTRGVLAYKLLPHQRPLYAALIDALNDPECVTYTIKCSRRFGKTTILSLLAMEYAIRTPEVQVNMASPTAKSLRRDVNTAIRMLTRDCPDTIRPKYNGLDTEWRFPNGSVLRLSGTDAQRYENLRGANSHLNIVDEAGSCSDLEYMLTDILLPQTLTTAGKTLLASTPAVSLAHDFTSISRECEANGYFKKFTVWDNTSLTKERILQYAKACGGVDSVSFRREYLCEDVTDTDWSIIPEWQPKWVQNTPESTLLDKHWNFYKRYVCMDIGTVDLTAILFATYDFKSGVLWVEDEIDINGTQVRTDVITMAVNTKEKELWGHLSPIVLPYRVADNNNIPLLQDLSREGVSFAATTKDNLVAMINQVRIMVQAGRVRVSPKCKKLAMCLQAGIWSSSLHNDFARLKGLGHLDHLAALIYLIRNIDYTSNPLPVTDTHPTYSREVVVPKDRAAQQNSATATAFANLFNPGYES